MRALFGVAMLIWLFGCASPPASTEAPIAAAPAVGDPVRMETRAFMDYITERTARRLVETCQSAANQTACIEDNLIVAFDETGNARRGCFESAIDVDPYKCVMLGAFNYSMARSAHLEDADHLDWSHPEAQLDRVMDGLADRSAAPA